MTEPLILVVGYANQPQTAHQINMLLARGARVVNLDPYGRNGEYAPLVWSDDYITWADYPIPANHVQGVILSANAPEFPTEDAFYKHPHGSINWEEWYQQFGLQRDRSDTLLGLLLHLEQHGVRMLNAPSKSLISRRKAFQIQAMRRAGCTLPATLITNDAKAARAFIKSHHECIAKPAAGGSLTVSANQLLEQGILERLHAAPAIFQERIIGKDVRVTIVNDEIVSSVIINVPEGLLDFRNAPGYQEGLTQYIEQPLPDEVAEQCRNAVKALGLTFSGIDLRLTSEGKYVMLECNSSPIYLDVEYKTKHPITEKMCSYLFIENPHNS